MAQGGALFTQKGRRRLLRRAALSHFCLDIFYSFTDLVNLVNLLSPFLELYQ